MTAVLSIDYITTPETICGDKEELKPLKAIFTLQPCLCGATLGYVTIGHVVCAWEETDEILSEFARLGEVVDAPEGAVLWRYLCGTPKCWNKVG